MGGPSTDETSITGIGASKANCRFVPLSENATFDPCCTLHEWLVFALRGSNEFDIDAASSALRAQAAQNEQVWYGLKV
ncbi:hypothetical protein ACFFUT_09235 [Pseudohalocynthiibacter aestuariivivens]|uniref:Uncharacterized protein n=1 Tax=Pseudohalocynthiibacter aestuariivivens TaxID=1591409 RepID=A0ABV5JET5_9RHOB|nr:hypothetical protein [Pseudohalocynthiibacter aestuariivivens]MBS9718516.1 hypothetical protein [Pseudohalocynthiibacter aestuariivivens]